jgi:hypothetical protein
VAVDSAGRHVSGSASATYTYFEPNGATCPAVGTAFGSINPGTAHVSANFTWARTGLIALVKLTNVTANGISEPNGTIVSIFAPAPKAPLGQPGGCDNTKTASAEIAAVVSGGTI